MRNATESRAGRAHRAAEPEASVSPSAAGMGGREAWDTQSQSQKGASEAQASAASHPHRPSGSGKPLGFSSLPPDLL